MVVGLARQRQNVTWAASRAFVLEPSIRGVLLRMGVPGRSTRKCTTICPGVHLAENP